MKILTRTQILLVKNKFFGSKKLNSLLVDICLCFLQNFITKKWIVSKHINLNRLENEYITSTVCFVSQFVFILKVKNYSSFFFMYSYIEFCKFQCVETDWEFETFSQFSVKKGYFAHDELTRNTEMTSPVYRPWIYRYSLPDSKESRVSMTSLRSLSISPVYRLISSLETLLNSEKLRPITFIKRQ